MQGVLVVVPHATAAPHHARSPISRRGIEYALVPTVTEQVRVHHADQIFGHGESLPVSARSEPAEAPCGAVLAPVGGLPHPDCRRCSAGPLLTPRQPSPFFQTGQKYLETRRQYRNGVGILYAVAPAGGGPRRNGLPDSEPGAAP